MRPVAGQIGPGNDLQGQQLEPLARVAAMAPGTGILLLSSWMVQQSIDEGTLLPLLPEWLASPYEDRQDEIHAVFRGGRFLKPQTRAFIDFLVEAIRPLQGPR